MIFFFVLELHITNIKDIIMTKKQIRLLRALGVDFSLASTISNSRFGNKVSNLTSVVKNKAAQVGSTAKNVGHRIATTTKNTGHIIANTPRDAIKATGTVIKDVASGIKSGWNAGKSHVNDVTTGAKNSMNEFKSSTSAKINAGKVALEAGTSGNTQQTLQRRTDNFINNAKDNIRRSNADKAISHGIKDINKGAENFRKNTNITSDNFKEQYGQFKKQTAKGYGQIKYGVNKFGESIGHSAGRAKQLIGGTVNRIFRRGRAFYY